MMPLALAVPTLAYIAHDNHQHVCVNVNKYPIDKGYEPHGSRHRHH